MGEKRIPGRTGSEEVEPGQLQFTLMQWRSFSRAGFQDKPLVQ